MHTEILRRFGSIHAFCKRHPQMGRSTVYQVIRGRYCGNAEKQTRRICRALEGKDRAELDAEALGKVLEREACAVCDAGKRRCRKMRPQCKGLWKRQAEAALAVFYRWTEEVEQ